MVMNTEYDAIDLVANDSRLPMNREELDELSDRLPSWIGTPGLIERIESVYAMYLQRHNLVDIAKAHRTRNGTPLTVRQVYADLERARKFRAAVFLESRREVLEEQVAVRKELVKDAREQLRMLRSPYLVYDKSKGTYVPRMDEDGREVQWTVADSKASRDLLRFISDQEQIIESLFGFFSKVIGNAVTVAPFSEMSPSPQSQSGAAVVKLKAGGVSLIEAEVVNPNKAD